jgi:hypothetical protein
LLSWQVGERHRYEGPEHVPRARSAGPAAGVLHGETDPLPLGAQFLVGVLQVDNLVPERPVLHPEVSGDGLLHGDRVHGHGCRPVEAALVDVVAAVLRGPDALAVVAGEEVVLCRALGGRHVVHPG